MLKDERKTDSEKKQKILDKLLPALQETRALSDVNYPPLACAEVGASIRRSLFCSATALAC